MAITSSLKPLAVALKGKGIATLFKRIWTIGKRYGLSTVNMDRSLERLSQMLQQFDCQATLPITATALARNGAIIQKYQAQGIEFAIHGYRHVDHSQLSAEELDVQFHKARQIFRDQGIDVEGFRCPYLRWNENTLSALKQTHFTYDSSASLFWDVAQKHTTDSYHRVLDFYGAQPLTDYLALPYLDTSNNLVRIPYCLPDDESLVERLIWNSSIEMSQVWPAIFRQIHDQGELFTLGLHPERIENCSEALLATLQEVQAVAPMVWRARLNEIAAWWKARYQTTINTDQVEDNVLQLSINGPEGTTLLLRSLNVKTATEPWFNHYQRATKLPCLIQTKQRPFIGISPNSDPALLSFLKQQGYIIEVSSNSDLYSFYLDKRHFLRQEERSLLVEIESGDFPLVRLGRWPNGAQSAFTITGDIDALTLWDYAHRLWEK